VFKSFPGGSNEKLKEMTRQRRRCWVGLEGARKFGAIPCPHGRATFCCICNKRLQFIFSFPAHSLPRRFQPTTGRAVLRKGQIPDRPPRSLPEDAVATSRAMVQLAYQTASGICCTSCSARGRTERPGRSRSPFRLGSEPASSFGRDA